MGKLHGMPLVVLFDTGASHSFISSACCDKLELKTERASHKKKILTPTGGTMTTTHVCSNIEIDLGTTRIKADNLSVLPMWDTDVILGMDWLSENHATILCSERKISFQVPGEEPTSFHGIEMGKFTPMISALQAKKMIKRGNQAFLVYLNKIDDIEMAMENVLVVQEFADVFPE